jgi:hypothetical protein
MGYSVSLTKEKFYSASKKTPMRPIIVASLPKKPTQQGFLPAS